MFTSGKVPFCCFEQYQAATQSENSLEFVVANSAASGSLSAKAKKVQGARVGARTGAGAIKLAEEMGEAREQARAI